MQWSNALKVFIVSAFNVKKMYVEVELLAAGENFGNLRFFIEFGPLFQQSSKKNWGRATPPRNYGLANAHRKKYLKHE